MRRSPGRGVPQQCLGPAPRGQPHQSRQRLLAPLWVSYLKEEGKLWKRGTVQEMMGMLSRGDRPGGPWLPAALPGCARTRQQREEKQEVLTIEVLGVGRDRGKGEVSDTFPGFGSP